MKMAENIFDRHLTELVNLWFKWIENHAISNNESLPFSVRRHSAELCQNLQHDRMELIDKLDSYIEENWVNEMGQESD